MFQSIKLEPQELMIKKFNKKGEAGRERRRENIS